VIPLKDNIPTERFPVVTVALIVINVLFFAWQWTFPTDPELSQVGIDEISQSSLSYGAMPYRITHPDERRDCSIGAVNDRNEPGVVCPGTSEFVEAEARGEANPGLALLPIEQAAWFITLFTSMFMHGPLCDRYADANIDADANADGNTDANQQPDAVADTDTGAHPGR
jgi:membrane associated rhomboid family serine protease